MPYRFFLLLCLTVPASAQPIHDLITDRPDFTESAVVVPLGHIQVETGATFAFDSDTEIISGPELLIRWTPLDRIELRFGAPDYIGGDGTSGFADPSLGLKAQFGPVNAWDVGLIATVYLPVGDDKLSTGSVDPEIIATMGRDLSSGISLGGQMLAARDGSTNLWTVGGSLVAGFALGRSPVGTFFEIATLAPEEQESETILNHGYTILVSRNIQFDAYGGVGLTDAAPDFALGVGLTVRQ